MKIAKKILLGIGILLLLLIGSAAILPIVFKDKIVAMIKEEANKNLNAKMDFSSFDLTLLSSFPDFKFELNKLSIVGIDKFEGDTLLSVASLKLNVNLMSVIKGEQYKINGILLDQPNINAIVLADSSANWDIAKPSTDTTKAVESSEPSKFKMTLKSFEIRNANITYNDAPGALSTSITNLTHTLKGDFTQDIFLLETLTTIDKFDLAMSGIKYLNKVKMMIKVDMDADMPNMKFTFKKNEFQLNNFAMGLDGYVAMPKDDIDMDIKFDTKKATFKDILSLVPGIFTKDFADVKTDGKLALDAWFKGIYNDKRMPAFGLKLLVERAMFQYPAVPKPVNNINIDVNIRNKDGQPDNTIIDINKFHVEMAQNPFDLAMHIITPVSDMAIDGTVKGKIDLSSMKEFVPLEADQSLNGIITSDILLKGKMSSIEKEKYDEFDAKGNITIAGMNYKSKDTPYGILISEMNLLFTPAFVDLVTFKSQMGKSDIQLSGKMENFLAYAFKDETLKANFAFNSTLLDLNELMGPDDTTAVATDTAAATVAEVPGNIDFVLNSKISKLIYDNMEMTDVSGGIVVRNSKASMENLKMNLLDGTMIVNGSYDTKNIKKPVVDFDLNISNFDVTKTYKTFNTIEKLAPIAKYATGKFSTTMLFKSDLDTKMEPVMNTLQGGGKLVTQNMLISGFEPMNKVAELTKMDKYKQLNLQNTNISYSFKDGKVDVEPFDVKMGNSNINIGGSNGFDQTINYVMKFDVPSSEFGGAANAAVNGLLAQAGGVVSMPERVKMDALVGGTASKPTVKLSMANSGKDAKDAVKDQAKALIDNKKAELEAKGREEADKLKAEAEAKARAEADKIKAEAEAKAKAEAEKIKKEAADKAKNEAGKQIKNLFGKPK